MEGSSARKTFVFGNKTVTVEEKGNLYKVTCSTETNSTGNGEYRTSTRGWTLSKHLGRQKAAWFVLLCSRPKASKKSLKRPVLAGKISPLLVEGLFKMAGAEWISLRMVHGARPIILKAPKLFHQRLIYIERIERQEGLPEAFTLRIVDPMSEDRTEPIEINRSQTEALVNTFRRPTEFHEQKENGR